MQIEEKLNCPNCGTEIPLTETLAAPFIKRVQEAANQSLQKTKDEAERRVQEAKAQVAEAAETMRMAVELESTVQTQINQALAAERLRIKEEERDSLRKELAPEVEAQIQRVRDLESKLATSQAAELALRNEKDVLDARARDIDIEVARRVDEKRAQIHEQVSIDAEAASKLKLAEKDKTIADMQAKLEEAQRKATQGSQQLQGEVLEMDFEAALRQAFPWDDIEPVKAGQRGGDVLQKVCAAAGVTSALIYWEVKNTSNWNNDWLHKAKQDARECGAEAVVIITNTLPKGEKTLCLSDGVIVCPPLLAIPIAHVLRQGLVETATARRSAEGRGTKAEMLYTYLMGPQFRAWLNGIAEPFVQMQRDLDSEMNATKKRWKRRQKHIERVQDSVTGLFGDLQGIAGSEMPELPVFEDSVEEEDD